MTGSTLEGASLWCRGEAEDEPLDSAANAREAMGSWLDPSSSRNAYGTNRS